MANITRENIGQLHDKINVKLTKEDYMPSFEKSLKSYAKNANIPGFRKGMVPLGMLKKMYGQEIFRNEVLNSAGKSIEDYINQEKLEIFAQPMVMQNENPMVMDMNKTDDFEFDFEVGLRPEFSIPDLNSVPNLIRYKVNVSEKLLEDETQRIQKRYGNIDDMTKVNSNDDIINATIIRTNETGTPNEGAEPKEIRFVLDTVPAQLKDQLKDAEVGTIKIFRPVDVATEEEIKPFVSQLLKADELANDGYFKMTIDKIGMLTPKELDAALFAEVFPNDNVTTLDAFKDKLKSEIAREFDRMSQERLNNEIFEYLVHQTPIELPVPFLKRYMKEGQEKMKTDAQVEQEFPGYDHQLRWTLISDKLIKDNEINVSKEDVLNVIKAQLLGQFGMGPDDDAPWMDSYLERIQQDEKVLNETYQRIMVDKIFAVLNNKFTPQEQSIEEEDFFKLPDAHAAHHHHH